MVTAAKTVSQAATHMGVGFAVMYAMTGSVAFGGLAALLEPIVNVALLPLHERAWAKLRARFAAGRARQIGLAAQKTSQLGMHMGVAFGVMYGVTGSLAFGGVAAVLEPLCNVVLLPVHDRAWEKIGPALIHNGG